MLAKSPAVLQNKVLLLEENLLLFYGDRPYRAENYDHDIVGALVATILSQHTSDINSGRAYLSLKGAFPQGWDTVRTSDTKAVADAIRTGGLADIKAERIQRVLTDIFVRTGYTNLDFLKTWAAPDIIKYLTSFHGVGPKTAACVALFNLGQPAVPVDTHVHRVSKRLGLTPFNASAAKTQEFLTDLVPHKLAYSFHVHLIEHGRKTCRSRNPACSHCPVSQWCDMYNGTVPLAI